MSLLATLKKNTSSPFARSINNSFIQENTSLTWDTEVPMMNVAFSGKMNIGFQSGITVWAGPSRHFKTLYALTQLNAWFKNNHDPDNAVALLYDTEYGITEDYLNQFPYLQKHLNQILHIPVNTLEELRHEASKQVEMLYETYRTDYKKAPKSTEKPNVFILIDSIGQVASNKETKDAVDGSEKADMTRAKMVKSIFRILTSKVKMLGIPTVVVAHTYQTMEMFSKAIVSGGTGIYYSADQIFVLGKSQEKDGTELLGYKFTINVEKSRFIRDKSKIGILVHFEKGILKYSGLQDLAKASGLISQCRVGRSGGWAFTVKGDDEEEIVAGEGVENPNTWKSLTKEIDTDDAFWKGVFDHSDFADVIEATYKIPINRTEAEQALINGSAIDLEGAIIGKNNLSEEA
jgi:hypothetical protein